MAVDKNDNFISKSNEHLEMISKMTKKKKKDILLMLMSVIYINPDLVIKSSSKFEKHKISR